MGLLSDELRDEASPPLERWRDFARRRSIPDVDALAIEARIAEESRALPADALDADEITLVALRRAAASDPSAAPYARQFAETVIGGASAGAAIADVTADARAAGETRAGSRDFAIMLLCAVAAGVAIKLPSLWGYRFEDHVGFFALNLSFFVLPFLGLYFGLTRPLSVRHAAFVAAAFVVGAVVVNVYPFATSGDTKTLAAIHLPIVLWLVLGVAFAAGEWRSDWRRMEFVRFTGEWLITYALIALGGGVLIAMTVGIFQSIGVDAGSFIAEWVLPVGAAGAVVVAAWFAEGRRNLAGGIAPMLARIFTPLFALMLVAVLAGVVITRGFLSIDRGALILFDLLLVVVLALLLYALSARDAERPPDWFDRIQLALVICALIVDAFALFSIAVRLGEYGLSANKVVALGLNVILLVNLVWSAYLQLRFVRGEGGFVPIVRWQMRYLPVYAAWAAFVVVVIPPLFRFA